MLSVLKQGSLLTNALFSFQNDEDLVAEEMRRTTEAAVSEDTMFEEPASDDGQLPSLNKHLVLRINYIRFNIARFKSVEFCTGDTYVKQR